MTGNIIVVLAVCGAAFYLYRLWIKTKNSDNPSCAGCSACQNDAPHTQKAILDSVPGKDDPDLNEPDNNK